jgi:SAM-dependent methyltransferase
MVARARRGADGRSTLCGLLRCPDCGAGIVIEAGSARCLGTAHSFAVIDGIPVLADEDLLGADPQYALQRRYFDAEYARYGTYRLDNWRLSYLQRLRSTGILGSKSTPLLDVGVGGSGYTVIEAARAGSLAIGCDLSLEAVLTARRFAATEGVADRTLWICCSAERLPVAPASVASAVAIAVIEHVPDHLGALQEMARVLRPGGKAWITVPHALAHISPLFRLPNRLHDRRLGHLRRYEVESLIEAGRSAGLNAERAQFTGHPVKVLQLASAGVLRGQIGDRFWWWCEKRDLARSADRRGSMQLSVIFSRAE